MSATDDLGDLTARLKLDTSDATSAVKGVADGFPLIGAAALAASAAVVGIGAVSVKMAADFQTAMTQLVTGAGESTANLQLVSDGILNMAGQVGESAQQLAQGMFMIESAGYHGAAGLQVLQAAAEGARVGNADLQTTADAVTTVMRDYGISASNAADATNFLVSVVSQGKTHMQDLASSLQAVLPAASALHVPLQDIGGALATLTARGTPAADAATYLRFTLSALAGEAGPGKKALEDIGLTAEAVGNTLTTKGLLPALQQIQEQLQKKFPQGGAEMFATLKEITGGTHGLGAALGLTGQNLDNYIASVAQVTSSMAGAHGQVLGWSAAQQDFNTKLDQAKGALESMGIRLGNLLLPALTSLADWLNTKGLPALQSFAGFVTTTVVPAFEQRMLPAIQAFAKWIEDHLIPAIENVGTWLWNDFINPVVHIGEAVLPVVVGAVQVLLDHLNQLRVPLEAIAITLGTMWAINKINDWWTAASAAVTKLLAMIDGTSAASVLPGIAGAGGAAATDTAAAGGLLAGPAAIVAAGITAPLAAWAIVLAKQISDNEQSFDDLNRRGDQAAQDMGLGGDELTTLKGFLQSGGQTLEDAFASFVSSSQFTSLNSQQQASLMSDLVDEIRTHKVTSVNSMLDFVTNWVALAQSSANGMTDALSVEDHLKWLRGQMPSLTNQIIDNFGKIGTNAGTAAGDAATIASELGKAAGDLADFGTHVSGLADGITSALGWAQTHAKQLQDALSGIQLPPLPTPSGPTSPFSAFGGHQFGGIIPPGQWGIVGEAGPELAFGGAGGLNVFARGNEPAGAGGIVINIGSISGPNLTADEIANEIAWAMK